MSFFSHLLILSYLIGVPIQQEFVRFIPEETRIERSENQMNVQLIFEVKQGYHIQAYDEVPDNIISTSIIFYENPHFEIIDHKFQVKEYNTVILDQTVHKVITGKFIIELNLKALKNPISTTMEGELNYQACDNRQCFYPRKLSFEVSL